MWDADSGEKVARLQIRCAATDPPPANKVAFSNPLISTIQSHGMQKVAEERA